MFLTKQYRRLLHPLQNFLRCCLLVLHMLLQGCRVELRKFKKANFSKVTKGYDKTKKVEKIVTTSVSTKVVSTRIPTPIVSRVSTTKAVKTTTRPIVKGIVIGSTTEGGSSSSSKPKPDMGKGKEIATEKTKEEKKAKIEAEMEKQRQIQSIQRLRENDPPFMEKEDPKKLYNYENIEARVSYNPMHFFEKKPKKSYSIENSDISQLDFPVNEMMFINAQYKIIEKFPKCCIGKEPEDIWSLVKIKRVISITEL